MLFFACRNRMRPSLSVSSITANAARPGRIARGKHTAIAGEPGDGKSQLSVYVAATISRVGEWPCGEGRAPVGNVIILNAEDGADDTVVPRLIDSCWQSVRRGVYGRTRTAAPLGPPWQ